MSEQSKIQRKTKIRFNKIKIMIWFKIRSNVVNIQAIKIR
jgi:hypothetical protein